LLFARVSLWDRLRLLYHVGAATIRLKAAIENEPPIPGLVNSNAFRNTVCRPCYSLLRNLLTRFTTTLESEEKPPASNWCE
jgi:hypothetical protein